MFTEDWQRLAYYVVARRVELGMRDRRALAAATGVTDRTLGKLENGLRVFAVYRACDIGLLVGLFAMHHWAGTASFYNGLPKLSGAQGVIVCLLLLLAASGKAAQVPFSGWLPRAMEGPTPSSAIFYGAISIHAGAYLLLRVQPLLSQSKLA